MKIFTRTFVLLVVGAGLGCASFGADDLSSDGYSDQFDDATATTEYSGDVITTTIVGVDGQVLDVVDNSYSKVRDALASLSEEERQAWGLGSRDWRTIIAHELNRDVYRRWRSQYAEAPLAEETVTFSKCECSDSGFYSCVVYCETEDDIALVQSTLWCALFSCWSDADACLNAKHECLDALAE